MNRVSILLLVLSTALLTIPVTRAMAHDPPQRRHEWRHHHPHEHGLRITSVAYRSPASRAGLERGDIILEVDGNDVRNSEQLHRALHRTGYRGVLTVRDGRSGRIQRVQVFPAGGHIGITVNQIAW